MVYGALTEVSRGLKVVFVVIKFVFWCKCMCVYPFLILALVQSAPFVKMCSSLKSYHSLLYVLISLLILNFLVLLMLSCNSG